MLDAEYQKKLHWEDSTSTKLDMWTKQNKTGQMSKEGKARVAVTARTQKEMCNSEIHMWLNISIIPTLLLFRQQVMSNSFAPPWTVV